MTHLPLIILALIAVALNVPFGAWRATTARLSARWFLAIHLPIPLVLLVRVTSGHTYRVIPLLVAATIAGQLLGSWAFQRRPAARRGAALAVPVTVDDKGPEPSSR
jgi:hypothetical protein